MFRLQCKEGAGGGGRGILDGLGSLRNVIKKFQTDKLGRQTNRFVGKQTEGRTNMWTDRQADKQADVQTDRHTDG